MRRLVAALFVSLSAAPPSAALAEDMVATRPGLMCVSADALAKLTRPDGSSAAAQPGAPATALATKRSGGCVDFAPGERVLVVNRRTNTSIVHAAGPGPATFVVPNIDFQAAPSGTPAVIQSVTAPGGGTVYYIMSKGHDEEGVNITTIEATHNGNAARQVLLGSHPSADPRSNLGGFSNLVLSPDGKRLFFQAHAWETSDAIHALDLTTGKEAFLMPGQIACVVRSGRWQGDVVASQHRYFVQGGSYDHFWLFDPTGKEIGLVSEDADGTKACRELQV